MLTKKNIRFLKGLAQKEKSLFQIGKNEITESHKKLFDDALSARELIKISVLTSVTGDIDELALNVARLANADLIEVKGRTFVLYRKNPKDIKIKFPV